MENDVYLSVRDVAKLFKVHTNTIRKWIAKEDLPARKLGNRFFIEREELKRWVAWTPTNPKD